MLDEIEKSDKSNLNSFKLFMLLGTQYMFFVLLNYCLYPADEPPKFRMRKLGKDFSRSHLTGETVRPVTRLTVPEIALLSRHAQMSPCAERQYRLNEEDQKIMLVLRDGETNYLKQKSQLFKDPTMNYGSLIMKRSANDFDFGKSAKELIEPAGEAVVETLVPLKRTKDMEKEKKKKNRERQDALDQLTRGDSVERNNIFSRIMPDRAGLSRKASKITSTKREKTTDATVEDADKTVQRAKKLKATKGFRNLVVNETSTKAPTIQKKVSEETNVGMKKKPSMMLQKTLEDQPSTLHANIQRTQEDLTAPRKPVV